MLHYKLVKLFAGFRIMAYKMKNIHLKYGFYRKPLNVLLAIFVAVTLCQGFYFMNPANQSWIHDP